MNGMNRNRRGVLGMKAAALSLAMAAAASASAVDLTIGVGESETLSGKRSFERIFCNGSLAIADGAEVYCTSFCMASGVVENVSVTLGNGASLSMPIGGGKEEAPCLIGCDGGAGRLTLGTNALFNTTKSVYVQYTTPQGDAFFTKENPFPTTAKIFIHLMDGASIDGQIAESTFVLGVGTTLTYGTYGNFVGNVVQLDKDASLSYCSFRHQSRPNCRILFNGGFLRQRYYNSACTATLASTVGWWAKNVAGARWYLTGTNGNDIVIQRDAYANAVFGLSSGGSKYTLDGDGGLVIRGTGGRHRTYLTSLVDEPHANTQSWIAMEFPGRIAIEGGNCLALASFSTTTSKTPRSDFFPAGSTLEVGPDATLNLYGADITNAAVVAKGEVINGSTNVSTIVTGGGNAGCRLETLGTNIVVRKSGTGCLTLGTNCADVASVEVSAGSLRIEGRDAEGSAARIRELTLGANVSCTAAESAKGRALAVGRLNMDATASVEVDAFAPLAGGALSLANYEGDLAKTPVRLPFKAAKTSGRRNLKTWSLYINGALCGAEGAANPAVGMYDRWLTLGNFGMVVSVR